jgi:small subunit ribosomal protein S8
MNNIIANLFSGLKNGSLINKKKIVQQYSKKSINILNILIKEGFIKNYIIKENKIIIFLKYKNNKSIFQNIKYIKNKEKNIYIKNKDLYKIKKNFLLISTTYGILTVIEAKKLNTGGKLICKLW